MYFNKVLLIPKYLDFFKSSYEKRNHIIEKFYNYAVKHSYGIMIFDVKRYRYYLKIEHSYV